MDAAYPRSYTSYAGATPSGISSASWMTPPHSRSAKVGTALQSDMDALMEMEKSLFMALLQHKDTGALAEPLSPPTALDGFGSSRNDILHLGTATSERITLGGDLGGEQHFTSTITPRRMFDFGAGREEFPHGGGLSTAGLLPSPPDHEAPLQRRRFMPAEDLRYSRREAHVKEQLVAETHPPLEGYPHQWPQCPQPASSSNSRLEQPAIEQSRQSTPAKDDEAGAEDERDEPVPMTTAPSFGDMECQKPSSFPEVPHVSLLEEPTADQGVDLEQQADPLGPLPRRKQQIAFKDVAQSPSPAPRPHISHLKEAEVDADSPERGSHEAEDGPDQSAEAYVSQRTDNSRPDSAGHLRNTTSSSASNEANTFTWMFGFPLPSGKADYDQVRLGRDVRRYGFKSLDTFFAHVFKIIQPKDVRELMQTSPPMASFASPSTQALQRAEDLDKSPRSRTDLHGPLRVKGDASVPLLPHRHLEKNSKWQVNSSSHMAIRGLRTFNRGSSVLRQSASALFGIEEDEEDIFEVRNAQQTSIELMLAFIPSFDRFCWDALQGRLSKRELKRRKRQAQIASGPSSAYSVDDCTSVQSIVFQSHSRDTIFICVRTSNDASELLADIAEYPVQLSAEGVRELQVSVPPDSTPTYAKYDAELRNLCRLHPHPHEPGKTSVLRQIDCIRVLFDKITDFVQVEMLQNTGLMSHSLPLHDRADIHHLRRTWGNLRLLFHLHQPLAEIHEYFGEAVAFYFLFLRELIRWTIGLLVMIVVLDVLFSFGNMSFFDQFGDRHLTVSILLFTWYVGFRKVWTRREALYANLWGTDSKNQCSSVKEQINTRLNTGVLKPSPEDAFRPRLQVSQWRQTAGRFASLVLSAAFLLAVMCLVAGECFFIYSVDSLLVTTLSGCFFGAQMKVVEAIWDKVSDHITDLEFRPTALAFAHSKTTKTFAIRFVNAFAEIFSMAYVRPWFNDPEVLGLSIADAEKYYQVHLWMKFLATFTTRYMLLGTANELMAPLKDINYRYLRHHNRGLSWTSKMLAKFGVTPALQKQSSMPNMAGPRTTSTGSSAESQYHVLSYLEEQAQMPEYGLNLLSADFLDTLIPLGFILFFGIIEPMSVLLLLVLLLVQVRVTAWKLVTVYRRPYPMAARDIGIFDHVLNFYIYCSIAFNLGLLLVDYGGLDSWGLERFLFPASTAQALRLQSFCSALLMALVMVLLLRLFDSLVPGVSDYVELERRRQDLQHHLLFFNAKGSERMKMREVAVGGMNMNDSGDANGGRLDFDRIPTLEENGSMFHRGKLNMCNVFQVLLSWIDPSESDRDEDSHSPDV